MPEITGTTRLIAIIADPIAHVRTPQVMNRRFLELGIDAVMVPLHVSPGSLSSVLTGLRQVRNFSGAVITVPHKMAAAGLCDDLSTEARLVGAVNCLRPGPDGTLVGAMFDGRGFVNGLLVRDIDPAGQSALVLGAGGAASAVAVALAAAGVARLTIHNRTPGKAQELAARIASAFPAVQVSEGPADGRTMTLVVNGTSLGMHDGDPLPLPIDTLDVGTVVAEVVMQPEETALLRAAAAAGCHIHPGRYMLEGQLGMLADYVSGREQ